MTVKISGPDPVGVLYREHHGWLETWLRNKLGGSPQAADIAQDTFLRILSRLEPGNCVSSLREPRAYLTSIAKRLMVDHWRRQAIEQAYLDTLQAMEEPLEPSPECRALVLEALNEVAAMLGRLPQKVQRAFLMSQMDGMSDHQIAAELGVSDRMVRKYLARAMYECLMLESLQTLGVQ